MTAASCAGSDVGKTASSRRGTTTGTQRTSIAGAWLRTTTAFTTATGVPSRTTTTTRTWTRLTLAPGPTTWQDRTAALESPQDFNHDGVKDGVGGDVHDGRPCSGLRRLRRRAGHRRLPRQPGRGLRRDGYTDDNEALKIGTDAGYPCGMQRAGRPTCSTAGQARTSWTCRTSSASSRRCGGWTRAHRPDCGLQRALGPGARSEHAVPERHQHLRHHDDVERDPGLAGVSADVRRAKGLQQDLSAGGTVALPEAATPRRGRVLARPLCTTNDGPRGQRPDLPGPAGAILGHPAEVRRKDAADPRRERG